MDELDLVRRSVAVPGGELAVMQPSEAAELPDAGAVEWAPIAPYWAVLWRSGVALAQDVATASLAGSRVVELGCGLGMPSLAAARTGAIALATDAEPKALALLERNARLNRVQVETACADWSEAAALTSRGPFDLVLAADVLYERPAVAQLLALLPALAPEVWLADPGRPAAEVFLERVAESWDVSSVSRGVVTIHRLRRAG